MKVGDAIKRAFTGKDDEAKAGRTFMLLATASVVMNACMSIVGPYLPPECEEKGIDMKMIGYIFV